MSRPYGVEWPSAHRWPVRLRNGSLVLRPLRRRDEDEWVRLRQRNRAWLRRWDATTPPGAQSTSTFASIVRAQRVSAKANEMLPFVMCHDGAWPGRSRERDWPIIGHVAVSGIVWGAARMGHIGYWIDEAYAGRGLMPRAVALVSDYCFQVLDMHRLEINIRPENEASLRVVQKLGYRPEGFRPRLLHIDGDWRDHLSFALTKDETGDGLLSRLQR